MVASPKLPEGGHSSSALPLLVVASHLCLKGQGLFGGPLSNAQMLTSSYKGHKAQPTVALLCLGEQNVQTMRKQCRFLCTKKESLKCAACVPLPCLKEVFLTTLDCIFWAEEHKLQISNFPFFEPKESIAVLTFHIKKFLLKKNTLSGQNPNLYTSFLEDMVKQHSVVNRFQIPLGITLGLTWNNSWNNSWNFYWNNS